jgi:hypothetical protein
MTTERETRDAQKRSCNEVCLSLRREGFYEAEAAVFINNPGDRVVVVFQDGRVFEGVPR